MLHDSEVYPEPEDFKPERFIKDGKINNAVRNPFTLAFGFGRRLVSNNPDVQDNIANNTDSFNYSICPGRHLSNASLFITIASVLHTFDIHPVVGEDGKRFDPSVDTATGLVSYVQFIFLCCIELG